MKLASRILTSLAGLVFLTVSNAYAQAAACNSACPQSFVRGSRFPFVEMITPQDITLPGDFGWHTIQQPCYTGELNGSESFNALIRVQYAIVGNTAPIGTNFETRISVYNGATLVSRSAYTRKIRGTIDRNHPQGEWFNAFAGSLAPTPTNYDIVLDVRVLASGTSMTVTYPFVTAQGSPTTYGGSTAADTLQKSVGASWVKLQETAFTTNGSENVNLILQSYMQFVSGNPGDQILIGFGIDDGSSNGHQSAVYVPSYFPDGVNAFDNIPNVGITATVLPGPHRAQVWAKNVSGGTTTVQYCQVQAMALPVSSGTLLYASVAGPQVASNHDWTGSTPNHEQPHACILQDEIVPPGTITSCSTDGMRIPGSGTWLKVLSLAFPVNAPSNWVGQGYIELLKPSPGETWRYGWAQIGVENIAHEPTEKSVDNALVSFTVPIVNGQAYFFLDAHRWGTAYGNTVNLWVRKVLVNYPDDQGSFIVGRAYIGVQTVAYGTASCEQ